MGKHLKSYYNQYPLPGSCDSSSMSCGPTANQYCCTKAQPCGFGEGDCDWDSQCSGELVCGKKIAPMTFLTTKEHLMTAAQIVVKILVLL